MIKTLCFKRRRCSLRSFLPLVFAVVLFFYVVFNQMRTKPRVPSSWDVTYPPRRLPEIIYEETEVPLPNIMYINTSLIPIHSGLTEAQLEENFFEYIIQKEVWCKKKERLGHPGEGGWNVCLPPPFGLRKPCIVYCFQTDQNWEFADAVSFIYGCHVYAYDPSLKDNKQNRSNLIHISTTGLGPTNGYNMNGWKLKTLKNLLKENGHTQTIISYLKIDIEYDEWPCLRMAIADGSLSNVKQLAFEIHTVPKKVMVNAAHEKSIRPHKKEYIEMHNILSQLQALNFQKFDYQRNTLIEYTSPVTNKSRSFAYELYYLNTKFTQQDYDAEV